MTKEEKNLQNAMTEGVIWKQLLLFFFPIVLGTFFQQLYNTADAIIVGKFVGKEALAAVGGTTGTLINLLVGFFVGLSSGASVIISQFFGARRPDDVSRAVHTTMALALASGAALTVLGIWSSRAVLVMMGTPEDVLGHAVTYINIYFLGMIPSLIYNIGSGILRAVGDSRRPLFFLISATMTNIVLDVVLVIGLDMGVAGAAAATVLSQVVSAVLTVRCIHGSQGMPWHLQLKNIRIERSVLLAICRIGLPGAAQSALYSISNMTIQSAINGFGTVAVAAWSVYGKIDFLFWMTVSSFGIAVTTFAGQNFGARQYDRVRRGTMTCLAMTAGTTLCISLALYPLAQLLFRLFSSDDAVVAQGVQMMHYLVPVYMTYICIEIFSGALRGCGDVRVPTIITVFAVCIMRIVWLAVALPFKHELSVVEFSYPLTWITATVLFAIYYAKGGWMQRCIAAQNAKTQG